jgi:hypothetical protein
LPLVTLGPAIVSKVTASRYAITGKLVCQGVSLGSYLEATSYFTTSGPDGKPLVTTVRTEGSNGAQSAIEGDDSNRVLELSFTLPANAAVDHITLTLHLEGNGWIAFADMKLVQYVDVPPAPPAPPVVSPLSKLTSQEPIVIDASSLDETYRREQDLLVVLQKNIAYAESPPGPQVRAYIQQKKALVDALRLAVEERNGSGFDWKSFLLGVVVTGLGLAMAGSFSLLKRRMAKRAHERELRRMASIDS